MIYKLFIIIYLIILFILLSNVYNFKIETFENSNKLNKLNTPIKIRVINLDKDRHRLIKFKKFCKGQKIEIERYPAINGKTLNKNSKLIKKYLSKDFKPASYYNYDASVGCALSHITLLNKLYNEYYDEPFFIICEDDAIVLPNFVDNLEVILKELPLDWDFVYLGASHAVGKSYSKHLIKPNFKKTNWGFFAYMVSKSGLKKLVKNGHNINNPIDNFYKDTKFKINFFTCAPFLIQHDFDNISNITGLNRNKDTKNYNKIIIEQ